MEKTTYQGALYSVLLTKYHSGDQIKKNEMDGACGMYGTGDMHIGFCWEDLRESDHLEDLGAGGWLMLKWIFKEWDGEAGTGLL